MQRVPPFKESGGLISWYLEVRLVLDFFYEMSPVCVGVFFNLQNGLALGDKLILVGQFKQADLRSGRSKSGVELQIEVT